MSVLGIRLGIWVFVFVGYLFWVFVWVFVGGLIAQRPRHITGPIDPVPATQPCPLQPSPPHPGQKTLNPAHCTTLRRTISQNNFFGAPIPNLSAYGTVFAHMALFGLLVLPKKHLTRHALCDVVHNNSHAHWVLSAPPSL